MYPDPNALEERLDARTEAKKVRNILELIQNHSFEVSEELDAYQKRHPGP
jgi:hypothetical protein